MRVTLKDIAKKTGLSVASISQILSPTSNRTIFFAESTRAQVRQVAQELGYRPNSAARSITSGRFGSIALLLSHYYYRSLLAPLLLDGISHAAEQLNLHLIVSCLPDNQLMDAERMPKLTRELACDGLLVKYNAHIPENLTQLLTGYQLPLVWINSKDSPCCVYPNDLRAGREVTEVLIAKGHRRIAFVNYTGGPKSGFRHYSQQDRRRGYIQAMQKAGLTPEFHEVPSSIAPSRQIERSLEWLGAGDHATAAVCYGRMEVEALAMTVARLGKSLPGTLDLATFHDQPVQNFGTPVTTALIPEFEIGYQAVQVLAEQIAAKAKGEPIQRVVRSLPMRIEALENPMSEYSAREVHRALQMP